ncbi:MAG: hypothetical protein ABFS56_08570 [Pseudomonadota bacterium]
MILDCCWSRQRCSLWTPSAGRFAGIGGFRLAGDELGIKTIWANDMLEYKVFQIIIVKEYLFMTNMLCMVMPPPMI